ncbi:TrbL/VirB6 plasmid conjugal transfer protein [Roseivivax halodurans JCM 10272]|uniref:TrbL/VirB6 plasmid conjugal transfer protein n=1 Tax=Roseivivax halodurans JCM 10272 TaxID=1449350 RepID=X7EBQ9_9RHOB|nr:type IV secretion system protein [Roseivivax halodurans]ETX13514.1 TrbL/VirB6 plasmid conjugal transfer protein [Roseivivax halodurans JCM 10272]
MGIISDILGQVDEAIATVSQDGFVASAGAVGDTLTAGSILLLIVIGINVVMQVQPMTFGSAFAFGLKISLIGIFAQSWDSFEVVYLIATDVPESIGASILALTDSGNEAGVYESLGSMVNRITAYGDAIGDRAGWVFGAVLGAIFFVLSALFAAVTAGIVAYGRIVFTLMIVIAPFMILTSLFKPTQSLFEAWSRATIGYALMPVAAAGAAGIIVAIAETVGEASVDPDSVETVSLILPFLVILLLSAGIMLAVPSIASNLTGVVALASNAVGLTGLARRGVVNAGEYGIGGAGRLLTGRTPYELRQGVSHAATQGNQLIRRSPAALLAVTKSFRRS